uniref:AAA+ ATPase domain-containing protein n=1 Tax=Globisporangium ultimum (strain ATCC 200006 / CBS 805.95 / DAOM BR144) TaxID=431595 RepID=K3W732_GLOUD
CDHKSPPGPTNDLFKVEINNGYTWSKVIPSANGPEDLPPPRWRHSAVLHGKKIIIFGGFSAEKRMNDLWIFNTELRVWEQKHPQGLWEGLPQCRGAHSATLVEDKMYIFGGGDLAESGTAQGAYLNSVMVLDTGIMEWVSPPVKGDFPTPRADTTMVFDKNTNHLTFFGGWANRWFNDLHVLNASEIVGPPYAISSIEPTSGPITGNAKIKVYGYNFAGQSANLRFAVAKGFVDVVGTVLNSTVIQATAPSFEKYGSLLTEVRASLSGGMYTNVSTSFKFHSVTAAPKTLAFGPCLISSLNDNCLAEFPTAFIIQSRDKDDNPRDCGGDEFTIVLKSYDEPSKPATPEAEDPPITSIIDKNDGTYVVTFAAPKAGKYQLSVDFNGTFAGTAGPVRGSPFTIFFQQPTEENKARCMPPLNSEKDMDSSDLIRRLMANMNKRNGEFRRILIDLRKDIPSNETDGLETLRKKIGGHVDKELVEIENMEKLFLDVQKQIPTTEQRTQKPTRIFSEKTEEKIIAYEKTITKKMETMKTLDFWSSKLDPEKGLEKIESYLVDWEMEMKKCEENTKLCSIFGFPQLMNESLRVMDLMRADAEGMKTVWAIIKRAKSFFVTTDQILFKNVDVNSLQIEIQSMLKELKKIPKEIQWCDAYTSILKECQSFDKTHPLIRCVSSTYMRPRHWQRIMAHTGQFPTPDEDPEQKLSLILSKNLHNFSSDITEICYEAEKEQELELRLIELEGLWAEVNWEMTAYNPGAPEEDVVPLLKTLNLVEPEGGGRPVATAFVSGVGHEIVDFVEPPVLEGEAEIYLETVMRAMRFTLFKHIERSLVKYTEMERVEWINFKDASGKPMDAAQIILLAAGVHYVQEVEKCFREMQGGDKESLQRYNKKQEKQLEDLIKLTQSNISSAERQRVMVLITMDAHGRDIVAGMIRAGVDDATSFQWQSQLKHYFSPTQGSFLKRDMNFRGINNSRAQILICDAGIPYDYEYLGNGPRLVITPLTDRIYVTATQALNLQMGCAPAGPAADDEKFILENDEVMLDPTVGAFITMNPGYLGRSELPEGLKALFRPMTVMVPDLVLICENMLMAEGFTQAKILASKFYGLYSLLGQLLSKQLHYDWGLRAVKSVLCVAGAFKRAEPDIPEIDLLMRALRDFNIPKIVAEDTVIFFGLLGDLFPRDSPNVDVRNDPPRKRDMELESMVQDNGDEDNNPKWIILDGDLDANWIESMNSVMDDNRMLTLASNERIPLKTHMRMIFEIRDLVWLERHCQVPHDHRLKNMMFTPDIRAKFQGLFDQYIEPTLKFFKKKLVPIVPVEDTTLVTNLLNMIDCLLTPHVLEDYTVMQNNFVFCCVWAFGSILTMSDDGTDYSAEFSNWWKNQWKDVKLVASASNTVFDFWLDPETSKFNSWSKSPYFYTETYKSPSPINQITVPTTETASIAFWLENLINKSIPIMVCGPAGTGKTQNIVGMLKKLSKDEATAAFKYCTINFNFYTTSGILQQAMFGQLERKTGINLGPPGKTKLIYFMDDLNLPEVDPYNTQSAISLLRQVMEYRHWFDRQKLQTQNILNTQVVAGMNPTAGSFLIDPRLQRHFCTFAMGMPEAPSLVTIYETFLGGHLSSFCDELSNVQFSNALIKAALSLHTSVVNTFRKTAANFHYEFNVRHLSNVFQGLIASKKQRFTTTEKFVLLWLHESERVYGDRLVCKADIEKYNQLVQLQVKRSFPACNTSRYYAAENSWPLIFCHFTKDGDPEYDQIMGTNLDDLKMNLQAQLRDYNNNENNTAMHLDLFDDAVKHVARIVRILRNESGHALLVGVGGSGKRSLARLASHICGYLVRQITISSKYGENEFKEDLRKMHMNVVEMLSRNEEDGGIVFMLTDSQITNEKFLIYLNDLLASGEVPDLFAMEDMDNIVNLLSPVAGTKDRKEVVKFFQAEIRKRLHLCLCFSPVGDDFRSRARKFPALVSCTVIDWFQPWPKEALLSVGREKLKEISDLLGSDDSRTGIENFMPFSFQSVNQCAERFFQVERRYVYTTPKSYLELLQLYKKILRKKVKEYGAAIERLEKGLQKLKETGETVARLEVELKGKLEAAEDKKAVASAIAETVNKEKANVEIESKKASEEAAKCAIIQAEVTEKQRSTQEDLAKAEPAVEQAMAALDSLNKKDLGECKTMSKPPAGVDDIFAATMVLLAGVHPNVQVTKAGKVKDAKWDTVKKQLLGNIPEYIDYLVGFKQVVDEGKVPVVNWKDVREYLEKEHFNYDTILTKNKAAAGLCSWVVNIVMYYDILITVEPKRQALAAANLELESANKRLHEVTTLVAELQAKLDKLLEEAAAAEKEKEDAINSVEQGNRKMKLAGTLTNDLSSENVRWGINVLQLQKEKDLLVGDVLLASAFISYIGPFTKPFRDELINKHWVPFLRKAANGESIAMSEESNPLTILTDDAQIAQWNTQKLPSDRVSTENGAIVVTTVTMGRRPLIIDPQLQAIAWIREMEAHNNLIIVRVGQKMWIERLKSAIGTDGAFLIENLGEKIDPILAPVIQRSTSRRGARYEIQIGDASVPYNDNFHLYLHTKLGNPHYPPEIQAECTIVNFTVTILGLEDQLLNLVVSKERNDLAVKREKLIQEQNNGKIELKKLEDDILFYLASADDDITNNQPLISILSDTKYKAQLTQNNMEAAKKTQESVNITSEKYRSIAARGSLLFFLMNDISKVHSYYIYSLASFQQVFLSGIYRVPIKNPESEPVAGGEGEEGATPGTGGGESEVPDLTDEEMLARCRILMDSITSCVYNYVRRGLFERDKLTVATMLTLKILLKDGLLSDSEVEYLLISKSHPDAGNAGSASEWLLAALWSKIKALEALKCFQGLGDAIQNDPDEWRKWFATEDAERQKLPGDFVKLSSFQRMILLRALRPDRVTNALRTFILDSLGEEYVSQPPFNMEATYEETNSSIPIFFVLFPGVDPTPWVEKLGRAKGVSLENGNFINISMGQGQEAYAGESLKKLATDGGWIILQNVHLMQSWLPTLERQLEEVATEGAHENFRCFISAEPPPLPDMLNIPESLMQSCIKVANEAPSDIQSNLRRAWTNFSEDKVQACTKPSDFKACLFALCWFHAIVLGRRRFGQQGWSRAYSFNTGDLTICANILHSYLDNNPSVPWDDLRYIFGEIMYGGHITDSWDRRTNNTYLTVLINPGLLNGMELGPGFKSPNPEEFNFAEYANYIEKNMVPEAPPLFGLHPNAEIGYLTTTCETLCYTIVTIGGGASGGGEGGGDKTSALRHMIDEFESRCPEFFSLLDLTELATPLLTEEHGPFVVVAMQECSRMNVLLEEIRISLGDLKKGLNGQLNMSQAMEDLATAMSLNEVPGRNPFSQCKWEKKAWPSKKSLSGWFTDMVKRYQQMQVWSTDFVTPFSIWLPGLFNPTAYTTACLQVTSRKKFMPLNQMTVETHVTTFQDLSQVTYYPDDGVFAHGLILEGARWSTLDEISERFHIGSSPSTECGGTLLDSNPKELLWTLPVVYVKAVQTKPSWEPSAVGYLRHDPSIYECPVYLTRFRGHTYIFLATLPTDCGGEKWVLRGVAILFQDDN